MEEWVELTLIEMQQAALTGIARFFDNVLNRRTPRYPCPPQQTLYNDVAGAMAEAAVAKWMGLYWGGHVNRFAGPDVGDRFQVRSRPEHDWDLPVFDSAKDDDVYVLVTGVAPKLCIRGAIVARDAKRAEWLKDYGGKGIENYFVPQGELKALRRREAAA